MPAEEFSMQQAVTWGLIVIGWIIVNYQNNLRETRKEARSMTDSAKKSTIDISLMAVKFLTAKDEPSIDLKSGLELLEIELERFPLFSAGGCLMDRFNAFAESVTGGEYESKDRTLKAADSPEVNAVFRTRTALLAELERQFKLHFC